MRILFAHQNFPGQYRHLLRKLVDEGGHQIVFLTQRKNEDFPGIRKIVYKTHREPHANTHVYLRRIEDAVLHGQAVARACLALKKSGFVPDVMLGHNGWGETLYLKDVFPDTPLNAYFEFFYSSKGADSDFDPEFPAAPDMPMRIRTWNAVNLMGLEAADYGQTPTYWQQGRYPERYRDLIHVCHEGIDTEHVRPNPDASVTLPGGTVLTKTDEVLTYVARNLEPYRGFHVFMRALPALQKRRPDAHVLIVGADGVSYGSRLPAGDSYKKRLLKEVGNQLDLSRVHFLGHLPYDQYLKVLQISTAHVYLTYPFVLSWSLMEAMSAGCIVIGSDTGPVTEVITDQVNGVLTDFFDKSSLVNKVEEVLGNRKKYLAVREAARQTIIDRYDLKAICLPFHRNMLNKILSERSNPVVAPNDASNAAPRVSVRQERPLTA